jgi:ABC-type cobalamin/Fe3+-siderophores transport system ATPase subunit
MDNGDLFPGHVQRHEEEQIRQEATRVREDRESRAVLLYGPGGVGKTSLVRQLARAGAADGTTIWVDPIDVDDSEYWLLSNLERRVADQLDPGREYFGSRITRGRASATRRLSAISAGSSVSSQTAIRTSHRGVARPSSSSSTRWKLSGACTCCSP